MKVRELNVVLGGGIYPKYIDRYTREEIDGGKLAGRERLKFLRREVYMIFPTEDPKRPIVSVY